MSQLVTIRMQRFLTNTIAAISLAVMPMRAADCSAQSVVPADLAAQKAEAEQFFQKSIRPFIKTYCLDCHQNRRPTEAGLSFTPALDTPGHAAFSEKWKKAVARVKAHDMPPEGLEQPSDEERLKFVQWLDKVKYLSPKDPGPFVIRRLTKTEYANTLRDLFGVDPKVADRLPDEVSGEGYLNSLSPLQLEQYLAITDQVVNQVIATDESSPTNWQREWIGQLPSESSNTGAAVEKIARSLAKNIYRRPASDDEVAVLLNVYELGRGKGLSETGSLRLMLKAMLVSPQFLFITPAVGAAAPVGIVPLDDHQIAARLSYLLWATMPDAELMALADSKRLHEPQTLKAQVYRMLDDPRSRALFDGFGAQWLGLTDLKTRAFDASKFPQMTDAMRSAMYDEVRLFFEDVVRNNHSVTRLIDSEYSFLNEDLAAIYGLPDAISGPEMRRVSLPDRNRGGILGMPGVLAATSFPNRTSPVIRGVWVLQQVLGEQVPSAPPDVPELETQDQESVANLTLRERTELHRTDPVCANCHKLLDPIGFGLENFDAIGRWRDQDENGRAIDSTGELPDGSRFTSPEELKAMIAGRVDDFSRNLLEKLLAYALCRRLEGYDEIVVDELMREIAADDYRMKTIVTAVVTSYPFTHRQTN
ncbi:DUF1592 domain-containing protein [Crateriforma spongiae]|uniref:DUF1592 domain-containing protein n=1 Tax=Crateriforma spongiae TaxID=2724528 RepID=UPI00197F1D84|nr:DUF1592 domain-containing protein [Crateriforma spongiae]